MSNRDYILHKKQIDWKSLTDEELKKVCALCCVCGTEIETYKAFEDSSICSKICLKKAEKVII